MAATIAKRISGFLAKYTPAVARSGKADRAWMRKRVPGGFEFVYDNYSALVFGFGPSERPSEAVLSLALMPQWVTLCFLKGKVLKDPKKVLRGGGSRVRHVRLIAPVHLDDPYVRGLIDQAIVLAMPPFPGASKPRTVIRAISAKQRPRRPKA